jgi:TetR/AcrR family transcriptional regulator
MSPQRTRDPETTKAAILDAAESVILEKGFGNTAVSEIARQAGVTKSLIHHHFGSKENLWAEVKKRRFDAYADQQIRMLEQAQASEDLLRESVEIFFRFLQKNPQLVRIMGWMFLEEDMGDCAFKDKELIALGTARLKEGQEAGLLRDDIDPRFILQIFTGLAQSWFMGKTHFVDEFGVEGLPEDLDEAFLEAMVRVFLEGVRPPAREG